MAVADSCRQISAVAGLRGALADVRVYVRAMNGSATPIIFRPKPATTVIVVTTVILLLPIAAIAVASKVVAGALGVATIAAAVWLAKSAKRIALEISPAGVTQHRRLSSSNMAWDDVAHYRYLSGQRNAGAAGGQAGLLGVLVVAAVQAAAARKNLPNRVFTLGSLKIFSRNGGKPVVISTQFRHASAAIEEAISHLHPRLTARPSYAPFSFDGNVLRHQKKGDIAFAEIEHVSVAAFTISIKKRDKRLMWANVAMANMDNCLLFLEQLSSAGVIVKAATEVFIPGPILQLVQQTAARHKALPQARVHTK